MLYGIPGESERDYEEMLELIPSLSHLMPPHSLRKVILTRFSRLYQNAGNHGICHVRPYEIYEYIYPENCDLKKMSELFEGDYPIAFDDKVLKERFFGVVRDWQKKWDSWVDRPRLELREEKEGYVVVDSRFGEEIRCGISGEEFELLDILDGGLSGAEGEGLLEDRNYKDVLGSLIDKKLVLGLGRAYLSVITKLG